CKFVGYPMESYGYYFYNPVEKKVFVSKTTVFLEKEFLLEENSGSKIELEEVQDHENNDDNLDEPEPAPIEQAPNTQELRKSDRIRRPPKRYEFLISEDKDVFLVEENEPTSYKEAISDIDSIKWLEAMKSEMDSMYTNQVWTLVDAPEGI